MSDLDAIFEKHYDVENIEPLLEILRTEGLSQIETIKFLKSKTQLPLKELDFMVLNAKTWADFREGNIKLRDAFFDTLDEMQ